MGGSDSRHLPSTPSFRWKSLARRRRIGSCGTEAGVDSLCSPLPGTPFGWSMSAALPFPRSRCRPPQDGHLFASLPACHGLGSTPVEFRRPRLHGRRNAGLLRCAHPFGAALRAGYLASLGSLYCYQVSFHVSIFTGLCQPSGGYVPPCGPQASLCTLHRSCFAIPPPSRFRALRWYCGGFRIVS